MNRRESRRSRHAAPAAEVPHDKHEKNRDRDGPAEELPSRESREPEMHASSLAREPQHVRRAFPEIGSRGMADWVTISALASAGGTLVLAGVTVASVRSANRAARVAELSLMAAQRPLLVNSRPDDPQQKVG